MRQPPAPTPEEPVFCRACRHDVTGEIALDGVRTCPGCGRPVRADGSNPAPRTPTRRRPECRCPDCGFDVSGIPGPSNTVRCPECGATVNLIYGPALEPWPGDREAVRRMLAYWPLALACYVVMLCLATAFALGPPGPGAVFFSLAFCGILSAGEAIERARRTVWSSVAARERWPAFIRIASIGIALTLACWLPVVGVSLAVLFLL